MLDDGILWDLPKKDSFTIFSCTQGGRFADGHNANGFSTPDADLDGELQVPSHTLTRSMQMHRKSVLQQEKFTFLQSQISHPYMWPSHCA